MPCNDARDLGAFQACTACRARCASQDCRQGYDELRNQVQSQQAELERLHKTIEEERKQHQAESERLRHERESAVKEAAELKGEAQALKAQNRELVDKLAERQGPGRPEKQWS
ncbi:MAG TPA: hypothetical protein V6D08_09470 [Candidatus Obscuribacterales bacterium]